MNSESTNSINRRYSVKDTLTKYFPGDTITEMRASDADGIKENREDILPLALAYADGMAIGQFLSEYFLVDTGLYDDYIAYFVKSRYGDEVLLSFMHFEDDLEFSLDPKYAYELIKEWEKKGYKARIMRNCVGIDHYPNSSKFRFVCHLCEDRGTDYLILIFNKSLANASPICYNKVTPKKERKEDENKNQCRASGRGKKGTQGNKGQEI